MAIQANRGDSCIWGYLSGVSWAGGPKVALRDFLQQYANASGGFMSQKPQRSLSRGLYSYYVFSGVTSEHYGQKLADYIRQYGLGTVYQTNPTENWSFHPGRRGQIYVWATDYDKICDWYDAVKAGKEPEKPKAVMEAISNTEAKTQRRKKEKVEPVVAPEGKKKLVSRRKKG